MQKKEKTSLAAFFKRNPQPKMLKYLPKRHFKTREVLLKLIAFSLLAIN